MNLFSVFALRLIIAALVLANLIQWWNLGFVLNIRGNSVSSANLTVTIDLDLLGNDSVRHRPHSFNLYSFMHNDVSNYNIKVVLLAKSSSNNCNRRPGSWGYSCCV